MRTKLLVPVLALLMLPLAQSTQAQSLTAFERNVTEHTLDNGLNILVVKRDVAPVATFMTFVNVGGADEPLGQSGVAHVFEHVAFKGSSRIGTTNYEEEKKVINEIDATYAKWLRESRSRTVNEVRRDSLLARFNELEELAKTYVVNNEFVQIVEREGARGLNAYTSFDVTAYFYSLPQNKAELWFSMEAERFKDPVMREFYVEKDVIMEERRSRTDSSPFGRLVEEFLAVAYTALPYRDALIGWPSDIEALTIAQAQKFYETYYVPSNMTIVIVGDVDSKKMIEFANLYFGDIPATEPAPQITVEEPAQRGERRFVIEERSQPLFISGYKTVDASHPDALALNILSGIMFEGRSSRMNRVIVEDKELAITVQGTNTFPAEKLQTLFVTYGLPSQGVSLEDLEAAIDIEFERIKNEPVTKEELESVVTRRRATLLRQLGNNNGLGNLLGSAEMTTGNWRTVFHNLDRMQEITPEDLQRVANTYFVKSQRTVGLLKTIEDEVASN